MSTRNAGNRTIWLHENDNVATALEDLPAGTEVAMDGWDRTVQLTIGIPFTHKFAIRDIGSGEDVIKYGVAIGQAMGSIRAGDHVHLHNMRSLQMEGEFDAGLQEGGWKNRNT